MIALIPENLDLDKIISKKGNALVKHIRRPKKDFLYFLISTVILTRKVMFWKKAE